MSDYEKLDGFDGIDDEWNIPSEIEVTQDVASCVVEISRLWGEVRAEPKPRMPTPLTPEDRQFLAFIGIKSE